MLPRQNEPTFRRLGVDRGVAERSEQRFGAAPAQLEYVPRKARGYIEVSGPPGVATGQGETLCCVHCRFHWIVEPGSGKHRGFCLNCNGPTCGKQDCEEKCVPFERAIEEMERIGNNVAKMRRDMGLDVSP